MAKKVREVRMVAEEGRPAGIRLTKHIEMSAGDVYLVPLPDLFPEGTHFSFHQSGRVHLKGMDGRVLATLDPIQLAAGIQTPAFDRALAKILVHPKGGRRARLVVSRPGAIPDLSVGPSSPEGVRDVAVGRIPESMYQVDVENTDRLPEVFRWLRRERVLVQRGPVFLEVKGAARAPVFLDLSFPDGREYPSPPKKFPREVSFLRNTLLVAARQLHQYGGIFIEIPEGQRLQRLARLVGLGDFYEVVTRMLDELPGAKVAAASKGFVQDMQFITAESVATLLEREPLKLTLPPPRK